MRHGETQKNKLQLNNFFRISTKKFLDETVKVVS